MNESFETNPSNPEQGQQLKQVFPIRALTPKRSDL